MSNNELGDAFRAAVDSGHWGDWQTTLRLIREAEQRPDVLEVRLMTLLNLYAPQAAPKGGASDE